LRRLSRWFYLWLLSRSSSVAGAEAWDTFAEVGAIVTSKFFTEMGATLRRYVLVGLAWPIVSIAGIFMGTLKLEASSSRRLFWDSRCRGSSGPCSRSCFRFERNQRHAAVAVTIAPMLAISIWQGTKSITDAIDMSKVFHAGAWSKVVDVIATGWFPHPRGDPLWPGARLVWSSWRCSASATASATSGAQLTSFDEGRARLDHHISGRHDRDRFGLIGWLDAPSPGGVPESRPETIGQANSDCGLN
jgi:hypothetical protein